MTAPASTPRPPSHINRIFSLLRTGPRGLLWRLLDQLQRTLTGTPLWRVSRITPQLYVGGQHRRWQGMAHEGISAVVNMREAHHDDIAKGIGGAAHLHLPTQDNTPPTLEDLERGAAFIAAHIAQGGKVYVHCGVGVGRAPTMAAAYLIRHQRCTPEGALRQIQAVRPFIHLTFCQKQQLAAFAERSTPPEQGYR